MQVEGRFTSEEFRAHHYLASQTASSLKRILEDHLLAPHLDTVLSMPNSGLDSMIDADKLDDLARLYRLFSMVPAGLQSMKKALKESLLRRGKEINEICAEGDVERDEGLELDPKGKGKGKARLAHSMIDSASKWVQDVLSLKDKFDQISKKAFQSDREIETGLNEVNYNLSIFQFCILLIWTKAFETFINLNKRSPEYISLFIDENLKKGLKGVCNLMILAYRVLTSVRLQKSDQEIDAVMDKTIIVFRYITEKDVFERYYKAHLAKRLLFGRSVSDDAERGILAKLKIECGYQFTQKLEGMFHDIKISGDTMEAYRAHLAKTTVCPPCCLSIQYTSYPTLYS